MNIMAVMGVMAVMGDPCLASLTPPLHVLLETQVVCTSPRCRPPHHGLSHTCTIELWQKKPNPADALESISCQPKMWLSLTNVQGASTGDFGHEACQRGKWVLKIGPKPAGVSRPGSGQAVVCLVKDGVSACRVNQTDRWEVSNWKVS